MQKALLLLAATALIAATPAADLDQNGEVSRAEFMAIGDARFSAADADFDGRLSRDDGFVRAPTRGAVALLRPSPIATRGRDRYGDKRKSL